MEYITNFVRCPYILQKWNTPTVVMILELGYDSSIVMNVYIYIYIYMYRVILANDDSQGSIADNNP